MHPTLFWLAAWLILSACGPATRVQAQDHTAQPLEELSKREMRRFQEGRSAFDLGDYEQAITVFEELLGKYPNQLDIRLLNAGAYALAHRYDEAIVNYTHIGRINPDAHYSLWRSLAEAYALSGRYELALEAYGTYQQRAPQAQAQARQKRIDQLRQAAHLKAHPVPFDPQRIGEPISTDRHDEYFAMLDPSGQTLTFTRRVDRRQEDLYQSHRQTDGSWGQPQPIAEINTDDNEGAQTVSADGRLMVITLCNRPDGQGGCDLYQSQYNNGRWSQPTNLRTINTRFSDKQPSLSGDGRLLFFASNRPGGQGAIDLWGSARRPDGSWTKPINLGEVVNTPENDHYPFFHPDGRSLYFSSNGHGGLGGDDLLLSRLDDNNRWTEPQNLGYPINDLGDDTGLFVSLDGRTALYARQDHPVKGRDALINIYQFELPPDRRAEPVAYLSAQVVSADTGQPIQANLRLRAVDDERTPLVGSSDKNGQFVRVLPAGKTYALLIDKEGYQYYTHQFELRGGADPDKPFELRVELKPATSPVEDQEEIVLRNVFFETGSAELMPASSDELDRLVALLESYPELRIEIAGHTDNVGSTADNQRLSEARARSVYDYLAAAGISIDRLRHTGYGESRPIADNTTEAGRAINRRTTFRVL